MGASFQPPPPSPAQISHHFSPPVYRFSLYCRGDDWTLLKTQEELDLSGLTLGELLKRKADEGVRVLVMIWGETTAIMGTHDTETENYFEGELGDACCYHRAAGARRREAFPLLSYAGAKYFWRSLRGHFNSLPKKNL